MKKSLIRIASIVAPILSGAAKALARIRPRIIAYAILPLLLLTGAIATAQAPVEPLQFGPDAINTILLLQQEKAQLAPHEQKIDSRLRRLIDSQRSPPRFPGLAGLASAQPNVDGTIALDIDTFAASDVKALVDAVGAAGGQVLHASTRYRSARVRLPVSAIIGIATLPGVRVIYPEHRATNNKVNTSEGDTTHRAAAARAFFGFDGTGVKACVMSNGVDSLAVARASGDLPPFVDVLPGQGGSGDEGTAMLEIIHDLAPGATLGFATSNLGPASFAQNIIDLKNAGCHVIVDDVLYFYESPFQDNSGADAINQVSAVGVLYYSSAGNSGNLDDGTAGTWEGNFNPNGAIAGLPAGTIAHNFGGGGQSDAFTAGSGSPVVLHWTDKFGTAANDYDLYVLDSTLTVVRDSSTNVQNGTGDPFEFVGSVFYNPGDRVVVLQHSGAQLRMINVATFGGQLTYNTSGATRGHNAAANAVSVAATPAAAFAGPPNPAGPYPNPFNASNVSELFSSDGPRRTFFDFAGNLLPGAPPGNFLATGGVVLQKPDVTAADGVQTSTPGFNFFFGTSAAAPHAAAIAALVKHAFPAKTAAQIKAAMIGSAIDIEGAGWGRTTGFGIVMAHETLQAQGATPSAVLNVGTVTRTQVTGNGNAYVDPGEDWKFDIVLSNVGVVQATAIVATLVSNTPGIVVTSPPVSYPNIANGGSASNPAGTPFRFSVTTAGCGTAGSFTLTVTYSGGNGVPLTKNIPITLGHLGTASTFAYTGPVVPIPDAVGANPGATATANLTVSGIAGLVGDVDFRFDGAVCTTAIGATTVGLDHTWVGDIVINLVAPDGTIVPVATRMNVGSNAGHNFCQTVLNDSSAGPIIDTVTGVFSAVHGELQALGATGRIHRQERQWDLEAAGDRLRTWGHRKYPRVFAADSPGRVRGGRQRRGSDRVQRRHHRRREPYRHHGRPRWQPVVHGIRRQPDRADYPARRRHRVQRRHHRRRGPYRHHGRPRWQPVVHGIQRQPDRADYPARRRHRVQRRHHRRRGALRHHGRPRWQPVVHGIRRQPDRADYPGRRRHRVQRRHHRRRGPLRHHGRPRWQPVVHGIERRPDRADHPGRASSPSSAPASPPARPLSASRPAPTATCGSRNLTATGSGGLPRSASSPSSAPASPPARSPSASRPAPMATCGSRKLVGNRIGRITPLGVVTEFSAGITAGAGPLGITAGPDGNLWFTEPNGNRIGRISTGAATAVGSARTFVSSGGLDIHPCTLTSPCRMLTAALAKTAPGGEIIVLDSAGYGPVVINKPMSIVAPPGVYAGISVLSGHGIDVNPGSGNVTLRGLTINGLGGDIGINFTSGSALFVERCVITGFTNMGLQVIAPAAANVYVRDSTFRGNFNGAFFGTMAGATGLLRTHVERSVFENNATAGIGFTGGGSNATISDSLLTGGTWGLYVNPGVGGALTNVEVRGVTIAKNATSGVRVGGIAGTSAVLNLASAQVTNNGIGIETLTGGTAYVTDSTITRNTTGIAHVSGTAVSLGDNRLTNNGTDGTFSSTLPKQ